MAGNPDNRLGRLHPMAAGSGVEVICLGLLIGIPIGSMVLWGLWDNFQSRKWTRSKRFAEIRNAANTPILKSDKTTPTK